MTAGPSPLIVDVREMIAAGKEPLPHLREAVARLRPGQPFVVIAPFLPSPLIERLRAEGFTANVARRHDGAWEVRFLREG